MNSEKYEIKVRNWNQPGNIKDYIANLNRLRRQNPALQQTFKLNFLQVDHDDTLGFLKHSIDGEETLAIAIAVSKPDQREFWLHFGDNEIGPPNARRRIVAVENLATGERHSVQWGGVRLRLDPNRDPMIALRCV
jgi:starch synthase (maltosyl-transferring)